MIRSRLSLAMLVLLPPGATLAAAAASERRVAQPQQESTPLADEDELDEVLVSGKKAARKPSVILTWMRRLLGTYAYEGIVDLHGKGEPKDFLTARGSGDCVGFGPSPALQCHLDVRWPERKGPNGEAIPGGTPNLSPAMLLFGFEPDELGVRYMLVDSNGFAEPALGLIVGDTLISRAPCVNIPGTCRKTTQITAQPDGKRVEIRIDVEVDYRRVLAYSFLLRRVANVQGEKKAEKR
jgi:hypothetical protein